MAILLVEHYLPLAKALMRGLEEEGIVTHLAREDVQAAARARSMEYAAMVVDWNIPRNGGTTLVRRLRQDGVKAPVVLLVRSTVETDPVQATDAGADDILPVPFSFADLLARLRSWT
jgi:two-component system response regulator QseB